MQPSPRRYNVPPIFFGIGFVLLFLGGKFVYDQIQEQRAAAEERNIVEQRYGEAIATQCKDLAGETIGIFPALTQPARLVVLQAGDQRLHPWQDTLPETWKAHNAEEVDLIVCAETREQAEQEFISECTGFFEMTDNGRRDFTVPRYRVTVDVTLIDPQNGQVIATRKFTGDDPECPASSSSTGFATISPYERGDKIIGQLPFEAISNWIESLRTVSVYGETLPALCQNIPTATAEPDDLNAATLLILDTQTGALHGWHDALSSDQLPASAEAVSVVLCVTEQEVPAGTCEGTGLTGVVAMPVVRFDYQIVAIDPTTETVIATGTIPGVPPPACPTSSSAFGLIDKWFTRDLPDVGVIEAWLAEQGIS